MDFEHTMCLPCCIDWINERVRCRVPVTFATLGKVISNDVIIGIVICRARLTTPLIQHHHHHLLIAAA
jgi:predicted metalloenzyme YecM